MSVQDINKKRGFISISKAASYLGLSADTLRNWELQGKLAPSRTQGGARRYNLSQLQKIKNELSIKIEKPKIHLIPISKASKSLNISADTLRSWDKKGLVESFRTTGGARRFAKSDLTRLQKELNIDTTSNINYQGKTISNFPAIEASKDTNDRFRSFWTAIISSFVILGVLIIGIFYAYTTQVSTNDSNNDLLFQNISASVEDLHLKVFKLQELLAISNPKIFDPPIYGPEISKVLGESIQNQKILTDNLETITNRGSITTTLLNLNGGANLGNLLTLANFSSDPSEASNGDLYYNSTDNKLRCLLNNSWKDCDTTSESSGDITAVNSGSGLTGGGNIGDLTIDILLTNSETTGLNSSNSGLEVTSSGLSLLKGCNDQEILKYTDAAGWHCQSLNTSISLNLITSATSTNSIDSASLTQEWDWSDITTQNGLILSGGNSMTTGSTLNIANQTYNHNNPESGSVLNIEFTDASTNLIGESITNGLNINSSINTSGTGTKKITGINIDAPTLAGCNSGSCTYSALKILATSGANLTTYGIFVDAGVGMGDEYAASFLNGNVGIGTKTPTSLLELASEDSLNKIAFKINSEETNNLETIFEIESDTTNNSQLPDTSKAQFRADGSLSISLTGDQTSNALCHTGSGKENNDLIVDCTGTLSDFAEKYPVEEGIGFGEIVTTSDIYVYDKSGTKVPVLKRSTSAYQNIIGITSDNYSDFSSIGNNYDSSINTKPVALVGRVLVKVTIENGAIKKGDFLTTSSTPGVAMKATKPGSVIGVALDDFTSFSNGLVLSFIKATYADPEDILTNLKFEPDGSLVTPKITAETITVSNDIQLKGVLKIGELALDSSYFLAVGDLISKFDQIDQTTSKYALEINSINNKLSTQESRVMSLESKEASNSAQLAETKKLSAEAIDQTESLANSVNQTTNKLTFLSSQIDTLLASYGLGNSSTDSSESSPNSVILSDSEGYNGLTSPEILLATDSATIADLNSIDNISTLNLQTSNFQTLEATISESLKSLGETQLASTTIAGDLVVDGTFSVTNGNTINSLGCHSELVSESWILKQAFGSEAQARRVQDDKCGVLFIQSSPLASLVDFFNGLVTINKNGQVRANSILVAEIKILANKTSGTATLLKNQKTLEIQNSKVTSSSRILITPTSETELVLAVTEKIPAEKFVVSSPITTTKDITFDYIIINEFDEN